MRTLAESMDTCGSKKSTPTTHSLVKFYTGQFLAKWTKTPKFCGVADVLRVPHGHYAKDALLVSEEILARQRPTPYIHPFAAFKDHR